MVSVPDHNITFFFLQLFFFPAPSVPFPLLDVWQKIVIFLRVAFCRRRAVRSLRLAFRRRPRFALPSGRFRVGTFSFPLKDAELISIRLFSFFDKRLKRPAPAFAVFSRRL